ncbi:MAG TPA: gluconolaconase [Sulfitobacter sp.]|nr:gluconolaconase [Sulfitobacter sp.]
MRILDSEQLELGEGPGYDPRRNTTWWFDIERSQLFLHELSSASTRTHQLSVAGSAMAVTEDGRYVVVAADGLHHFDPVRSTMRLLYSLEADQPHLRSNDARVHPSGHLWVSTMGWKAEPKAGSIYLFHEGRFKKIASEITIPNAICFSPDGKIGYFTDTRDGRIMKVALDPDAGCPVARPEVYIADLGGNPDGAVTDAEGNIWITLFGAGRIVVYDPSGQKVGEMTAPTPNVTCPAFIGRDARHMLVTTALFGMTETERALDAQAGATFVTPINVAGRFDPPIKL